MTDFCFIISALGMFSFERSKLHFLGKIQKGKSKSGKKYKKVNVMQKHLQFPHPSKSECQLKCCELSEKSCPSKTAYICIKMQAECLPNKLFYLRNPISSQRVIANREMIFHLVQKPYPVQEMHVLTNPNHIGGSEIVGFNFKKMP